MTTNDNAIDNGGLRITRIRAKNYRSIRELDLELGPLTVLVGPNAAGKSNVLDILRFVRDAISRGLDFAISQRHGLAGLQHRSGRVRSRYVELGFRATIEEFTLNYTVVLARDPNGGHRVKREYGWYKLDSEAMQVPLDIRDGRVIEPNPVVDWGWLSFNTEDLSFFKYHRLFLEEGPNNLANNGSFLSYQLIRISRLFSTIGFHHAVPDSIREPQRQLTPDRLNEHGENLASVVRHMQRSDALSRDLSDIKGILGHVVPGITDVRSARVGGYLVLKFKHSNNTEGKETWLDATQESDGTLRILALLTAIFQHRRPPLLGIEEPESAIHPGVLNALAEILAEASLRQQLVITTHSPDLIDQFPIECIRSVEFLDGRTEVGKVSKRQVKAVKDRLFTAGELHRMEGLEIHPPVAQ